MTTTTFHVICEKDYTYNSSSTDQLATSTVGCDLSVPAISIGVMVGALVFIATVAWLINYFKFKN